MAFDGYLMTGQNRFSCPLQCVVWLIYLRLLSSQLPNTIGVVSVREKGDFDRVLTQHINGARDRASMFYLFKKSTIRDRFTSVARRFNNLMHVRAILMTSHM